MFEGIELDRLVLEKAKLDKVKKLSAPIEQQKIDIEFRIDKLQATISLDTTKLAHTLFNIYLSHGTAKVVRPDGACLVLENVAKGSNDLDYIRNIRSQAWILADQAINFKVRYCPTVTSLKRPA